MNALQVLLVEDDAEFARDFCPNLKKVLPTKLTAMKGGSVEIRHATNQQDADSAVREKAPDGYDLVLLDLLYPESPSIPLKRDRYFQGMRWLPQLRRLQPNAAIVIITSYPYESQLLNVVNAIRDSHADDFVPKTATLDEIVGRICIALANAHRTQTLRRLEEESHRSLRSHAAIVLTDDAGQLVEQTVAGLRRIARGIKKGDPAAIASAPQEIETKCRVFKEEYANLTSLFEDLKTTRQGTVDVVELAREMLLLYDQRIEEVGAEARKLGQEGITVTSYESDLRIALYEVLWNTIDSLSESAVSPGCRKLSVHVERNQKDAIIRVLDNGPEFTKESIQQEFEPRRPTRKDGKHVGLGLYIAKRMMEAIGGSMEARNRDGGGAEVVLSIPDLGRP